MFSKIKQFLKFEILNSFNPELQLKGNSTLKDNSKLIELLTQLRGFKFVMTLVLRFQKNRK